MKFTAKQIADLLKGTIEGNHNAEVNALSKIEEGKPGTLSFLSNPKYAPYIYDTKASVVIVNKDFVAENAISATLIRVEDAYKSFASLLEIYNQIVNDKQGVETPSYIDPSATVGEQGYIGAFAYIGKNAVIGKNVKIYPHCYIGDHVIIGDNSTLFPGVRVYSFCQIGSHVNIHSGVIIGADGFGFAPNENNNYKKVPQIGNVVIHDHVEIGAGTTIDRATLGSTVIHKGVKLDNLIQIAHNVEIGENTVIAAQTGIAGSTKIGKNCMIGGQVGIIGHLTIADGVKIAAQSGIGTSITTPNEIVQGSPAFNISDYKRTYVVFKKLPQIERKINELEKKTGSLNPAENKS